MRPLRLTAARADLVPLQQRVDVLLRAANQFPDANAPNLAYTPPDAQSLADEFNTATVIEL
jgi:hypothetical protein